MLVRNPDQTIDVGLLRLGQAVRASGYRFVTPTPATHALVLRRPGPAGARDLRDVFGWSRTFRAETVPPPLLDAMRDAGALIECDDGYRSAVRFSSIADDLFVHSSYPTVGADAVFFGPDTYRFARAVVQHRRDGRLGPVRRAVDIGCGAGPGAVVVARLWPRAEMFGVDINPAALRMARVNAALAGVNGEFLESDLLSGVAGRFDLIVSNPPYLLDPGERTYRHGGGPLGAGLSLKILEAALDRLEVGGTLLLYTGSAIVDGVDAFLAASRDRVAGANVSWTYDEIDPDVFGEEVAHGAYATADRIAAVLLTATRKD